MSVREKIAKVIVKFSNTVWSKSGLEWNWVKLEAILGMIWIILILASNGNDSSITGQLGLFLVEVWIFILVTAVITYPIMQPIHRRNT